MGDDLKNYEDKLVYFVIFNIVLFLLVNFDFDVILKHIELISLILTITPLLYFPIYVINNALSEKIKFIVLFPLKYNHHFASDIFTKLSSNEIKDDKIDVDLIIKNHYQPKDYDEEDELWYDIYWEHRYNQKVYEHHRQFLFCRDFTMMILPLTMFYLILSYFLKISLSHVEIIFIIAIVEFFLFWWLTRYQNKKFVLVVLEEENYKLKKENQGKNEKQKNH